LTAAALARRIAWHLRTDAEFQRLGWRRGRFLRMYYLGRIRDRLIRQPRPIIRRFDLRHGVTGRPAAVHIRTSPGVGDWIVLRGVWIHQDYYHPSLHGSRTILDVGANIGVAALWLQGLLPHARVACVEPDVRNVPLATLNLEANGIAPVVLPYAVAPRRGRMRLGIGSDTAQSALEGDSPFAHAHQRSVEVEVRRLPDLLDELGWPRVDVLKLDIEGTERDLLADAGDWLDRVGLMLLELHPNTTAEEIGGFLRPHGWSLERIGREAEETYVARPKDGRTP
jgi:FkbM family methyltransferase